MNSFMITISNGNQISGLNIICSGVTTPKSLFSRKKIKLLKNAKDFQ